MQAAKKKDEIILVVDQNNEVIGQAPRSEVNQKQMWHRASYVFIFSANGFMVQKRSITKGYCPGFWDLANGGVMDPGETDLENAIREIQEEVGIDKEESEKMVYVKTVPFVT